jgi:hypothetical protein
MSFLELSPMMTSLGCWLWAAIDASALSSRSGRLYVGTPMHIEKEAPLVCVLLLAGLLIL